MPSAKRHHSHRCPCGRKFQCTGVTFTDGTLAALWPCPRWECPRCNSRTGKRWNDWLKTAPEARRGRLGTDNEP